MIEIVRDKEEVQLRVTLHIPYYETRVFSFKFNCSSECYAGLLAHHISKTLGRLLQGIRANAYNKGYADGKAKRAKEIYFSPCFKD